MHTVVHKLVFVSQNIELTKNYDFVAIPRAGDIIRLQNGITVEIENVIWETTDPEAIMAVTLVSLIRYSTPNYYKERGYA